MSPAALFDLTGPAGDVCCSSAKGSRAGVNNRSSMWRAQLDRGQRERPPVAAPQPTSGGRSDRRAGGGADFLRACEAEMRPDGHAVVSSMIECRAICFWEQRVDLNGTDQRL